MTASLFVSAVSVFFLGGSIGFAQERTITPQKNKAAVSCEEFAPPSKEVKGKPLGVEECQIISEETVFNIKGQKFRRVEIRLTGTVEGWVSEKRGITFTDGPDFVFTQFGVTGPRSHGVGRYEASTGHGMTIPRIPVTGMGSFT